MREERKMGPRCEDTHCKRNKWYECNMISEEARKVLFAKFLNDLISWEESLCCK